MMKKYYSIQRMLDDTTLPAGTLIAKTKTYYRRARSSKDRIAGSIAQCWNPRDGLHKDFLVIGMFPMEIR